MDSLPKAVGPRVEARVVTWNRSLQVRSQFTSDGDLLVALLRNLKKETAWGDLPARERDAIFQEINSAVQPNRDLEIYIANAVSKIRLWPDQRAQEIDSTLT